MGRRLLVIGIAGFVLAACGSEKSGGKEAEPGKAAAAALPQPAPPAGDAKEIPAEPEQAAGRRVTGTAVVTADAGGGLEGKIELILADGDGPVRGTLELDGRSFALAGFLDGGELRLWAEAGAGDPATVRRGYVTGQAAGGALAGDFALSDSGGTWSARGTWKSDD
jgi:hypothetical protein